MSEAPLRVLIVDDSATVRHHLTALIAETSDMVVVGEAHDGQEAIALAARLQPNVISMDVLMPRLDGLAATRHLMQQMPLPIVIVTSRLRRSEVDLAFLALQAGALAVVETPPSRDQPDFPVRRDQFLTTLRAMAKVSLVRRWGQTGQLPSAATALHEAAPPVVNMRPQVIAIGASAGGPMALRVILGALPAGLSAPIAVVQHMAEGFVDGMVRWLDTCTPLRVMEAQQGQVVRPGEVVVAGSGAHLTLQRAGNGVRVTLLTDRLDSAYQPSVDVLFESLAQNFGARALGILLTGMGADGARGLLAMRQRGARTLVQDRQTCLVYGMPGAAVERGAAEQIVPLDRIAPTILDLL